MLHIKFTSRPFDKLQTQCAVVTTFADQKPFQGNAALLDWRLNGRLSQIVMRSRFGAEFKEVLLMPSEGRLQSKAVLVFGLGARNQFNESSVGNFIHFFLDSIARQKITSFLVSFSELIPTHFEWRNSVRLLVSKLHDFPEIETVILSESDDRIREAKRRHMDFGMNVEVSFEGNA